MLNVVMDNFRFIHLYHILYIFCYINKIIQGSTCKNYL